MDKYLRLEFFKRQGFPTKMDGVEFIEKTPKLKKLMAKLHADIEDYKCEKVDEFEQNFDKFDEEKKVFLVGVKDKRKERIEEKKKISKLALKDELRAEILKELEAEKEAELAQVHADLIPKYDKDSIDVELDRKFTAVAKNKANLTKKQVDEVKALKKEAEAAFHVLAKVSERLEKYM